MTEPIELSADCEERLLAERVRQCVPLRHPAFGKLLQLLSIEASDEVDTAAVTLGSRSRLLLNPTFIAEHCHTDAHLSMLVMHELYHVLLGHTRMYRRATLIDNWVFDCIINAQLCRLFPGVEFTSFFTTHAADEGPWSLIGPPPGWPHSPRYARGPLGDVHRRLYDDAGVTTMELFALLDQLVLAPGEEGSKRLLGNHDASCADTDPLYADPDLLAEVRRIVARWPMVVQRNGADDGRALTRKHHKPRRHETARRAICKLLQIAACGSGNGPWLQRRIDTTACTALAQAGDRRAQLQRLMGFQPLLWQGTMQHSEPVPTGQVTVYLDVSGSMEPWLPVLLDALSSAAMLVRWPLLGFSTEIHPVTREELAAGRFRSTGGTHIACVARHLVESGMRRAVVITDGDVQGAPASLVERLRRTRQYVRVGLPDGCDASFCRRLGWPVTRIPALDKGIHRSRDPDQN